VLHDAPRARTTVAFDDFARVMAADREWRATHWERDRELTTPERFARVARALDLDDPALPGILTAVHMGMLESIAVAPPHHAALLAACANARRPARTDLDAQRAAIRGTQLRSS
jgi:hypothetical protein